MNRSALRRGWCLRSGAGSVRLPLRSSISIAHRGKWRAWPSPTGGLLSTSSTLYKTRRFVPRLAGLQDALEALTDPEVMIREVHPQGDCDCFTMFLCALMACQSIPWEIVTLACSPRQPGVWWHVFPRAVIGGLYLPMDASHGKYPGWSVPSRDIQRLRSGTETGIRSAGQFPLKKRLCKWSGRKAVA